MRNSKAFTLIELLVVVAIITILLAILMPSLSRARDQSYTVYCASNLRQIGAAVQMYKSENTNYYMPFSRTGTATWTDGPMTDPITSAYVPRYFNYLQYYTNTYEVLNCPTITRGQACYDVGSRFAVLNFRGEFGNPNFVVPGRAYYGATCNYSYAAQSFSISETMCLKEASVQELFETAGALAANAILMMDGNDQVSDVSTIPPSGIWRSYQAFSPYRYPHLNNKAANALYADGHAERVRAPIWDPSGNASNGHIFGKKVSFQGINRQVVWTY